MRPCKSCGTMIHLLETPSGKWMPVDVEPHPGGNLAIDLKASTVETLTAEEATDRRLAGKPLHLSHFGTCPYATRHRRR